MRILKINPLCGIKNQMYSSEQYVDDKKEHLISNSFFDINSLFWSEFFSKKHVEEILSLADKRLKDDTSPKVKAVIENPKCFIRTYIEALEVFNKPVTQQNLFECLETLEIICHIYTKIHSTPFKLTITEGYIHEAFSSKDLLDRCLLPFCNPYLSFIEKSVIPKIIEYDPDILVFSGKPNIASFAIAKIIKEKKSKTFIIAAEHESDYYSFKKIKNLLATNTAFFSVYDCVILGDYSKTITKIEDALLKGDTNLFTYIPGIIYCVDNKKKIFITDDKQQSLFDDLQIPSTNDGVLNLKLFPLNHCYWNKCAFCGINSKYSQKENNWCLDFATTTISKLHENGVERMWLLDEAIPFDILLQLAKFILSKKINILWHVRTRIEPQFIDESIAKIFWDSGLRHILFGFESASTRILHKMNKYKFDFDYIDIAEKTVKTFEKQGIQVHFSTIIGFPTETTAEIAETAEFLKYMQTQYSNFSYNVNTFYLDIGSKLFKHWSTMGINHLAFPCEPEFFLDNHLIWNSATSENNLYAIQEEQEKIMSSQYSWYPNGALLSKSEFFSFWEYSRYCLYSSKTQLLPCSYGIKKKHFSDFVSFSKIDNDNWLLYNLKNHHYVVGGSILNEISNAERNCISIDTVTDNYEGTYKQTVESLIQKLTRTGFFV